MAKFFQNIIGFVVANNAMKETEIRFSATEAPTIIIDSQLLGKIMLTSNSSTLSFSAGDEGFIYTETECIGFFHITNLNSTVYLPVSSSGNKYKIVNGSLYTWTTDESAATQVTTGYIKYIK